MDEPKKNIPIVVHEMVLRVHLPCYHQLETIQFVKGTIHEFDTSILSCSILQNFTQIVENFSSEKQLANF